LQEDRNKIKRIKKEHVKGRDHLDKLGVDGRMLKLTLGEGEKGDFDYIDQALIQSNGERL